VAADARECVIDGVENETVNVETSEHVNTLEGTGANTRCEDGLSDDLVGAQSSVGPDIQE
jgi:hypothetical protein